MTRKYGRLCFVAFPEDWRGRTIEIFRDGAVMLDSGLFSRERKQQGWVPFRTRLITDTDTPASLEAWINRNTECFE